MKKILILVCSLFVVSVAYTFRPMNLRKAVESTSNGQFEIVLEETKPVDENNYSYEKWSFVISAEDEEFENILEICDKYSYRYSKWDTGSKMVQMVSSTGVIETGSIHINHHILSKENCYIGEKVCEIGYRKEDFESLYHELVNEIKSWDIEHTYVQRTYNRTNNVN